METPDTKKPINEANATNQRIKSLFSDNWPRFEPMRKRIRVVRDSLRGETQFKLPDDFDVAGKENLIVKFPTKITVPLQVVNLLERTPPRLTRYATNPGLRAASVASDVETWINAVCELLIPWRKLVEKTFLEGACAVGAVPMPAHWRQAPTFLDTLDDARFLKLSDKKKSDYKPTDDGWVRKDADDEPMPKKRYFRDSKNRAEDDDWYKEENKSRKFKEDRKATRKAWEDERKHWLARRLPFVVRVESAMDCIPFFGEEDQLIGLLIRTKIDTEDGIYEDLIWDHKAHVMKEQDDNGEDDDAGGDVLFEWWFLNEKHEPCVAYSINLTPTHRKNDDGDKVEAVINLREEYGLTRLPWKWVEGMRLDTGDLATRTIPYNWPVLPVLTAMEAIATSILIHTYTMAFGGWAVDVNAELAKNNPDIVMEGTKPRIHKFSPMTISMLPGRPIPLVHPGPGGSAEGLMKLFLDQAQAQQASAAAFGGSGAASGHDRALTREYLETAMDQVRSGLLEAWEFIGETLLEEACGMIENMEDDESIPVYENTPIQQINANDKTANKSGKYRAVIELKPDWVGEIYDLEAEYPKSVSENLAQLEQLANHYQAGLVTWREYREKGHGDPAPEQTLIEVWVDQYLRTDAGRAEISKLAEKLMRGEFDAQKEELIAQGVLLPDGTPADMLVEGGQGMVRPGAMANGGRPPEMSPASAGGPPTGPEPTGGLVQTDVPGGAQSVLGGIVSGGIGMGPQMQDAVAAAQV